MKMPAFQFYPADWRKDPGVQSLDFETRGIWFEILCIMHESDQRGKLLLNGSPMPEDALARLLGLDNQILTKALTKLHAYGVYGVCEDSGAIISRRMVRDENLCQIRRECGKRGGNPLLVNQKPTTGVNQKPTPSSSSSPSGTPIVPKGDGEKKSSNLPESAEAKRIAKIFHRRETTGWSTKEIKTFKELGQIEGDDLAAVEKYYKGEESNPKRVLRHDLGTFLNNFRGEVDRANRWKGFAAPDEFKLPNIGS